MDRIRLSLLCTQMGAKDILPRGRRQASYGVLRRPTTHSLIQQLSTHSLIQRLVLACDVSLARHQVVLLGFEGAMQTCRPAILPQRTAGFPHAVTVAGASASRRGVAALLL